jgi:hypothetical protein
VLVKIGAVQTIRRIFRKAAWLAFGAILALAVVPTLSHALAAMDGSGPWDICTATTDFAAAHGGVRIDGIATHLQHCPLCGVSGTTPALPPVAGAVLPEPEGADYVAAASPHGRATRLAWALARSRAPPPAT